MKKPRGMSGRKKSAGSMPSKPKIARISKNKSFSVIDIEPDQNEHMDVQSYGSVNSGDSGYSVNSGDSSYNNNSISNNNSQASKKYSDTKNEGIIRTRSKAHLLPEKKYVDEAGVPLLQKSRKRSVVPKIDEEYNRLSRPKTFAYLGLCFTLCSSIGSSLSALTVKLLENDMSPFVISFWRFCTLGVISSCVLLFTKFCTRTVIWPTVDEEDRADRKKSLLLLGVRGLLGALGRVLYIYSITCMNLGDAMVIASSTPVFMTLFAYLLIGEKCGIIPVLVSFGTLVGVGVISRPPFLTGGESYDHKLLVGTETGMAGMILTTLVMIAMRKLRNIHHSLATLSLAIFGMIITASIALYNQEFNLPQETHHIFLLFASGLSSFLGQTFLTLALHHENLALVSLLKNFDVVFSFIWAFMFFGDAPDLYSLGGGCIVIFFIVVSTLRKWLESLPEDHVYRHKFGFMLR